MSGVKLYFFQPWFLCGNKLLAYLQLRPPPHTKPQLRENARRREGPPDKLMWISFWFLDGDGSKSDNTEFYMSILYMFNNPKNCMTIQRNIRSTGQYCICYMFDNMQFETSMCKVITTSQQSCWWTWVHVAWFWACIYFSSKFYQKRLGDANQSWSGAC